MCAIGLRAEATSSTARTSAATSASVNVKSTSVESSICAASRKPIRRANARPVSSSWTKRTIRSAATGRRNTAALKMWVSSADST